MNHLAHFHLSYGNDELLLGALLGDFVKGPLKGDLSAGLEQGIWLHRKIDSYTDSHPDVRALQTLFEQRFRRYSGIMLDVVFDHFLSRHWSRFHHQPLAVFSEEVYALLSRHSLPVSRAAQQAQRLVRYDALQSYHHWQTVGRALDRIDQRFKHPTPLPDAAAELDKSYAELERGFLDFYPQLMTHCKALRQSGASGR